MMKLVHTLDRLDGNRTLDDLLSDVIWPLAQ